MTDDMPDQTKPLMTSDFSWTSVSQVRCGVLVSNVTDLLTRCPREVVEMPLREWTLVEDAGQSAVVHLRGIANGFQPNNVPKALEGTVPVLVGCGNKRRFLIDGAHRVARALQEGRKTIQAVFLTEEETRACVREGQLERFERETR